MQNRPGSDLDGLRKKGMDHTVQNRPGSNLDGLIRVWPNASGLEASQCAGIIGPVSGRTQPARYQFPTFRLGSVLPQTSRIIIVPNQPGSDSVLADCVRFWPNGSGPEASRCARIIRPASGQCWPADPGRMRIGSGMFAGILALDR